jgi:phosphohistidine phosphatase
VLEAALANGFCRTDALALLAAHGDENVLVTGHEPTFSQVVYDLTGGRVDFKKGGVAAVRVDGGRGELLVLLRPKELEALGAGG